MTRAPSYAVLLNRADLLVHVGLRARDRLAAAARSSSRATRTSRSASRGNLDASTAASPIQDVGVGVSRTQGDIHPLGNPHYHLPPDNGARGRARDPRSPESPRLRRRAPTSTTASPSSRRSSTPSARSGRPRPRRSRGVKVVTYHKSWSYFDDWLGLKEIGYLEPKPGIPPDPQHLAQLVNESKAQGAKILIMETYYPRNTAQRVADLAGMKLAVLNSDVVSGQNYFTLIDSLIDQLLKALG